MTRKRKSSTRTKRKSSRQKGSKLRWVGSAVLVLFLAGAAYLAVFHMPQSRTLKAGAIESIFLSADIRDSRISHKDVEEVRHWRVEVPNKAKQDALVRALTQLAETHQLHMEMVDQQTLEGAKHTLYAIGTSDAPQHRILLVMKTPREAPQKPKNDQTFISQNTLDPDGQARIAIIIDDVGGKGPSQIHDLMALNLPITFAVIPFLSHSTSVATHLHQNHYEVMLHMPMEPGNYPAANPGEGAIFSHMNAAEIQAAMAKALSNVPFVVGVNNHMGSKITASRALMREILAELKRRDLYFVDSRTHKSTIAFELAQEMDVRSAERKVFLDSEERYEYTIQQLEETQRKADEMGAVIAIGHPYDSTIRALVEMLPKLDRQGYAFVFASELVHGSESHL
ncbi:MAG: divergent polysaccharide deacetylase family protein [Acidobacteria bacterium]|nr:divergent polysaccharide deacetylase family protein [Acidobacteriota bacterium]